MHRTEINGRTYVHPGLTQREAMRHAATIVRVCGRPAVRVLGAVLANVRDLAAVPRTGSTMEQATAYAAALRDVVSEDDVVMLLDLASSDAVADLTLSLLDGCTVDGLVIRAADPESLDAAYPLVDPWAPLQAAVWVALEHRLFPLPGGSTSATGGE